MLASFGRTLGTCDAIQKGNTGHFQLPLGTHEPKLGLGGSRALAAKVRKELIMGIMLLPLMCYDLRTPVSDLITASDASESGGGVCYSKTLTKVGALRLARELSMQGTGTRDKVGLVELFAGIGGGRMAFDTLGLELAFYA